MLLNKGDYIKVSLVAKHLHNLKKKLNIKNKNLFSVIKKHKEELQNIYKIKIDYLEFRNEKDLTFAKPNKKYRLFIAYSIGNVRLIDNF